MTKWHEYVAHMAKHMNIVGGPGPGPLAPLNPAFLRSVVCSLLCGMLSYIQSDRGLSFMFRELNSYLM